MKRREAVEKEDERGHMIYFKIISGDQADQTLTSSHDM